MLGAFSTPAKNVGHAYSQARCWAGMIFGAILAPWTLQHSPAALAERLICMLDVLHGCPMADADDAQHLSVSMQGRHQVLLRTSTLLHSTLQTVSLNLYPPLRHAGHGAAVMGRANIPVGI